MTVTEKLADHMTKTPKTVEPHQSAALAHELMREGGFRHLPVCSGGKLVGAISLRDIDFAWSIDGSKESQFKVMDLMASSPVTMRSDESLKTAVRQMVDQKIGSIIVTGEKDQVVGIFTEFDAMMTLLHRLS